MNKEKNESFHYEEEKIHPKVLKCIKLLEQNGMAIQDIAYSKFMYENILKRGIALKPYFLWSLPTTILAVIIPLLIALYLVNFLSKGFLDNFLNSPFKLGFLLLILISKIVTHYFFVSLKVRKKINLHKWSEC